MMNELWIPGTPAEGAEWTAMQDMTGECRSVIRVSFDDAVERMREHSGFARDVCVDLLLTALEGGV